MTYRTIPTRELPDGRKRYHCTALSPWFCYATSWAKAEIAHAHLCVTCRSRIEAEREIRAKVRWMDRLMARGMSADEARRIINA